MLLFAMFVVKHKFFSSVTLVSYNAINSAVLFNYISDPDDF